MSSSFSLAFFFFAPNFSIYLGKKNPLPWSSSLSLYTFFFYAVQPFLAPFDFNVFFLVLSKTRGKKNYFFPKTWLLSYGLYKNSRMDFRCSVRDSRTLNPRIAGHLPQRCVFQAKTLWFLLDYFPRLVTTVMFASHHHRHKVFGRCAGKQNKHIDRKFLALAYHRKSTRPHDSACTGPLGFESAFKTFVPGVPVDSRLVSRVDTQKIFFKNTEHQYIETNWRHEQHLTQKRKLKITLQK